MKRKGGIEENLIENGRHHEEEDDKDTHNQNSHDQVNQLDSNPSNLPLELQFFKYFVLDQKVVYYCYQTVFYGYLLAFIVLIVYQSKWMFTSNVATYYNSFFILQACLIFILFPLQLSFLNQTIYNSEIHKMIEEVVKYEKRFQFRIQFISSINFLAFLTAIVVYGLNQSGGWIGNINISFFLIIVFPLPLSITMILILMDCHRRLSDRFIHFLKFPIQLNETSQQSEVNLHELFSHSQRNSNQISHSDLYSNLFYSNHLLLFDFRNSLNSNQHNNSLTLSNHITFIHCQFLLLHDQYEYTSIQYGLVISLISLNSLLLMAYLVWTIYLFTPSFTSILGFVLVDLLVLIEVFIWTSLANESGYNVCEALTNHSLRITLKDDTTIENKTNLIHLLTCLPFTRLEIYGIGKLTIRFKLAFTITLGFAVSIIPKLVL